jgi:hypothetical protein
MCRRNYNELGTILIEEVLTELCKIPTQGNGFLLHIAPDFDFLHIMGRVVGHAIFKVEREDMRHGQVLEFLVFNKQEDTD